ncbi:hypothetical protein I7I51_03663 [Histoplasma capsulatum]|uniref:Uncharacterized protein n=1 Tax=Ajellomyces capsulatus TaxID=5037 RepID=A0A8A1M4T3_AJECA|nr:hypothetical protein I7I51_03663 [Histoplasma capsulatum]
MALFGARVDVRIGQAVTDVVTDSGPRLLVEVDSVGETSSFPSESLSSKDGSPAQGLSCYFRIISKTKGDTVFQPMVAVALARSRTFVFTSDIKGGSGLWPTTKCRERLVNILISSGEAAGRGLVKIKHSSFG